MAHGAHSPGFHPHLPGAGHRWLGKLIGASMWFFMFYRIREDGPKVFLGQHPFHHGHEEHDAHH
ncbi:hypothetical protein HDZ31DRAFT_59917 [Schizophyllum fasciatum]